jgi:uncharacterized protein (DUF1778 family)
MEISHSAAVLVAEDLPMETKIIRMSSAGFKAFVEALSAPARPVPEMVKLFQRAAPWESKDTIDEGDRRSPPGSL